MTEDTDRDQETTGESEVGLGKERVKSEKGAIPRKETVDGIEMASGMGIGMVYATGGTRREVEVGRNTEHGEAGVYRDSDMYGS